MSCMSIIMICTNCARSCEAFVHMAGYDVVNLAQHVSLAHLVALLVLGQGLPIAVVVVQLNQCAVGGHPAHTHAQQYREGHYETTQTLALYNSEISVCGLVWTWFEIKDFTSQKVGDQCWMSQNYHSIILWHSTSDPNFLASKVLNFESLVYRTA